MKVLSRTDRSSSFADVGAPYSLWLPDRSQMAARMHHSCCQGGSSLAVLVQHAGLLHRTIHEPDPDPKTSRSFIILYYVHLNQLFVYEYCF